MKYWYKVYFVLLYMYDFVDFGLVEIKIFNIFEKLVRIVWIWVLFCYSI